jgi:UDP:flavonoid glycosyltransferase YjiC (YdhE family)
MKAAPLGELDGPGLYCRMNSHQSLRKRILFVAETVTLAHVTRLLVLARSLDPNQYEVHFASDQAGDFVLRNEPFQKWPITSLSSQVFLANLAKGAPLYNRQTLLDYVADDRRLLEQVRPDLVVGDLRLSLGVSAPLCNVPYAALTNAHWSPFAKPRPFPLPEVPATRWLGCGLTSAVFAMLQPALFAWHARPLNAVRRHFGLPAVGGLLHVYTHGDYTLYADIPDWIPMRETPANHLFLGPIQWSPDNGLPPWWNDLNHTWPSIYVTLGSSGAIGALPAVIEALSARPVNVLIATAGRTDLVPRSENVRLAEYLPGMAAARRSALVICNGGSPTSYQGLAAGVPVLGIVSNMDQCLTMRTICERGAGRMVRAGSARPAALIQAIDALLEDPHYREAAEQIARQFEVHEPCARFNAFLKVVFGQGVVAGRPLPGLRPDLSQRER